MRWLFYILYAAAVACLAYFVGENAMKSNKAHSAAVREMHTNHYVTAEDLVPIERNALVGHYLRHDVKPDNPIAPTDVSDKPVFVKQPNTFAAILTVPRDLAQKPEIEATGKVMICRNGKPLGEPAVVQTIACSESGDCSMTVALPKISNQTVDPDALTDATIATVGGQAPCASKTP